MGHDPKVRREEVNLSLPAELLQRARAHTGDLDGTVEELLERFVRRQEAQGADAGLWLLSCFGPRCRSTRSLRPA